MTSPTVLGDDRSQLKKEQSGIIYFLVQQRTAFVAQKLSNPQN